MEFTLNEQTYRTGRLDARKQLHVGRRCAPLMAAASKVENPKDLKDALLQTFGSVADVLSKMGEADVDYVLDACLAVCERKQGDKWTKVMVNGAVMFSDMNAATLFRIAKETVEENLAPFLPVSEPASTPADQPPTSS